MIDVLQRVQEVKERKKHKMKNLMEILRLRVVVVRTNLKHWTSDCHSRREPRLENRERKEVSLNGRCLVKDRTWIR